METFNIYPKEGKMFPLVFSRFEFDGSKFTFYDSTDSESKHGYLAVEHVAAIKPERERSYDNPITYLVYLKNQANEPLEIRAHGFRLDGSILTFFWLFHSGDNSADRPVYYTYVALSEGVAVLPSGGLNRQDW